MTDNELIAEFMGGQRSQRSPDTVFYFTPDFRGSRFWHIDYIPFDRSWDWLMPVVEKIETIYDTGIFYDGNRQPDVHNIRIYAKRGGSETLVISYGKSKIETTYKAVVEFIKWYNQNK